MIYFLSFILTFLLIKYWIELAKQRGLVGRDMNKFEEVYVAEGGGVPFLMGTIPVIILLSLFYPEKSLEILAISSSILLLGMIGFVDDVLGWKKGLPQWVKPVLTILAALPISVVVYMRGLSGLSLDPFIYAWIAVPIGIVGASNGFNMLAGFNGLEGGLALIILSTLGVKAFMEGNLWLFDIILVFIAALLAFLYYNWYPARIFPGDSFTYAIGGLIASITIFGGMEVIGVALYTLFILKLILFLRARFLDKKKKVEAFGIPQRDGTLKKPYDKWYDTTHIAMDILGKHSTERNVVLLILTAQLIISTLVLLVM